MRKFLHVDFVAGLGAMAFAIASRFVPELAELVDSKIAGGFALVALGRWFRALSSTPPAPVPATPVLPSSDPSAKDTPDESDDDEGEGDDEGEAKPSSPKNGANSGGG